MPTNPYYQFTSGQPVALSRASSAAIRTEFGTIQSGFDAVNTAVIGKGAIAGQTWTGTHNFPATTYGVTAAFGSSGNALATLDFVNAVATSAALPGQTGKTDYLLTTNGSTESFSNTINVSVNKLVDGTDKTKQVQIDASGITTGTTRHLTVQDKDGTLACTSDINAANGTSMALLGQATVSTAVAYIDFLSIFTATYDTYVIVAEGLSPSADDNLYVRLASAGVVDTANNYFAGSDNVAAGSGSSFVATTNQVGNAGSSTVRIEVGNTNSASQLKSITAAGSYQSATPDKRAIMRGGGYIAANAVSGFRLYWTSGANFTAGTVRVYGIKNN